MIYHNEQEEKRWGTAGFSIEELDLPLPSSKKIDYSIVRRGILFLPQQEREVIMLKFWGGYNISAISDQLGLRNRVVEQLLCQAYVSLREFCLRHPTFSRNASPHGEAFPLAA